MLEWSTKGLFCAKTVILVQNGVNSDAMVAESWRFATFYDKKGRMKKAWKILKPETLGKNSKISFFL